MKMGTLYLAACMASAGLIGCAGTKVEEQVDREALREPPRSMHGELAGSGLDRIHASTSLGETEKRKLLDLQAKMAGDTFEIHDEISRLKGVLFETIAKKPYDAAKMDVLKKKLVKLNDQKMAKMFSALTQVEEILGVVSSQEERRELLREIMMERQMWR